MERAKIVNIEGARARRPQQRVPVPASIFVERANPSFVLFDSKGQLVAPAAVRTVYVSPGDLPDLDSYIRTHLPSLSADQYLAPADRLWVLQRVLQHEARDALRLRSGYRAQGLIAASKQVAAYALASEGRLSYLGDTGEDGPVALATNRALYAVALAVASGLREPAALSGMTVAAVFADSGNLMLPPELLAGSQDLTEEQRRLLRGHPERSAEIVQRSGIASELVLRAVRGHHERWDGGGYPLGVRGTTNPIEERILAVADGFATMTSQRPQASPHDPYDALREMSKNRGQHGTKLLRSFVPCVGRAIGLRRRAGGAA